MLSPPQRALTSIAIAMSLGAFLGLMSETFHHELRSLVIGGSGLLLFGGALPFLATRLSRNLIIRWFAAIAIWSGAFLLAGANAAWQDAKLRMVDSLPAHATHVTLTAIVTTEPDHYTLSNGTMVQKFIAHIDDPSAASQGLANSNEVRVAWFGRPGHGDPTYGDRWSFSGELHPTDRALPPYCELVPDRAQSRRLASGQGNTWMATSVATRQTCRALLTAGIESFGPQKAALNALLLGYMDDLSAESRLWFAQCGTLHIFAISGTHIVIVAGIAIFGLTCLGIPRTRWFIALIPFLIFYTYVTGLQISAIRAVVMAVLFWGAPCLGRRPDIFSALSLAAILILIIAPHQILSPGCILSFVVTLGLAASYAPVLRLFKPKLEPDPMALQADAPVMKLGRMLGHFLLELVVASTVAWLVSAPLIAIFFSMISPIGLIANLVIIPLAFLSIVTGFLSLAFGLLLPWVGVTFNHANVALAGMMLNSMSYFASLPGGHIQIAPPGIGFVVAYYVLYSLIIVRLRVRISRQD